MGAGAGSSYAQTVSGRDAYRRSAGVYDRFIEPLQAGVRRVALDVVPPQPGWDVLDVGCGTGTGLAAYLEAGCDVAGVEVSQAMFERARDRLGDQADLQLTDGGPLPFGDGRFDLVATSMVLHEVPEDQRAALIGEMARVARDDGRLLITDFRFGPLRGWKGPTLKVVHEVIEGVSGHYSGFRSFRAAGGVPHLLDETGLEIEREKIIAGGNLAIYVVTPSIS